MARPMPMGLPAPVTIAIFPASSLFCIFAFLLSRP